MGMIAPFLVPITLFLTIGAVVILRGPLGKALGERLSGKHGALPQQGESEALRAELDEMRYRLGELEERVDFTERMLARQKETDRLGPGAA